MVGGWQLMYEVTDHGESLLVLTNHDKATDFKVRAHQMPLPHTVQEMILAHTPPSALAPASARAPHNTSTVCHHTTPHLSTIRNFPPNQRD